MGQMIKDIKKYFIDHNSSTKKAINQMNKLGGQSLIVVKNRNTLRGILSSYDLRKAIMNKNILNKNISKIYNKKPKYIFSDELNKKISEVHFKIKELHILPIVKRKSKKIIDILTYKKIKNLKFNNLEKINCSVVIMAGGKGTRLKPYTEILPKPLLPIDNKPAIRHILEKFNIYNPNKFYVTLNYKSEILKSYFKEIKESFKVETINEKKPLGTAGSLYFLKNKIKNNFFLTNCDTIVNANYSEILKQHLKNKNDITVVVAKKTFSIPYGVFNINKRNFSFSEKPKFKFYVNVGLYLLSKNILNLIRKKTYLDFNTLLSNCKRRNKKVGYYKIKYRQWIDVGEMEKYKNFINKKI